MIQPRTLGWMAAAGAMLFNAASYAEEITAEGRPAQLDIRAAGKHSVRVTLKPLNLEEEFPFTPALAKRDYPEPSISLRGIKEPVEKAVGNLQVEVRPDPLTVVVRNADDKTVQEVIFKKDGTLSFKLGGQPVLGMGEGGPEGRGRREIEFDRRGRLHNMRPRWQSGEYGSRNPVAMMAGTEGWGLFVATPWGQIDLQDDQRGTFTPWDPPSPEKRRRARRDRRRNITPQIQGRPPIESIVPGAYDLFIFDAHDPANLMKDLSVISGPAAMPPKWSLGYMQSHRELRDDHFDNEELLLWVVDTFREKQIPVDAVIYLGTGFTPTGWNTRQPSFDFNPEVFKREPAKVIDDLHERNVKVVVHIVPWKRDRLPTLQGTIPPEEGETLDESHILNYWKQHVDLVDAGIDAWWPDEGDWFNLFERIKRHQLYYQGPLSTKPNIRPWSLHRNGHLGVAQWGGWVWSGDTMSRWKTLEGQIAVGINHSLSLGPYWGSDTGGFYTTSELTGELYARWFQFSAFCPSFRSHGRIWRLRLPFGWGLSDMGYLEGQKDPPNSSEMNNQLIEPVTRKYAELRYQLLPYTYTLAAEARDTGMPFMRAMWLHYPEDHTVRDMGDQYLWGRDLLVAPVYTPGASARDVYLPKGQWYDWWTNAVEPGSRTVTREVDLATMPLYVRAGAIIPFDPIRQYTAQEVNEPTRIRIYAGSDGAFRWYEDDGASLDYQEGEFSWTHLKWEDRERRLTIEREDGEGSLTSDARTLVVELLPGGASKQIEYDGQRAEVEF